MSLFDHVPTDARSNVPVTNGAINEADADADVPVFVEVPRYAIAN